MKPTLLVLAAGIGSRYGGLKQVDSIGMAGEAILEYSIFDAIKAGFGKVVFVIRHSIEADFKEKFAGKFDNKIIVEYVFQEIDSPIEGVTQFPNREKPWGTGHAMLVAKDVINEPFLVINADDYYGAESFQLMADFLTNEVSTNTYGMVAYILGNTLSENGSVSRGVCNVDENHHLVSVTERTKILKEADGIYYYEGDAGTKLPNDAKVSMNFWGFHPNVFEYAREMFLAFLDNNKDNPKAEFYIPLVVNNLIQSNTINLKVMTTHEQWYGVTYTNDKETVQAAFKTLTENGTYPLGLWKS